MVKGNSSLRKRIEFVDRCSICGILDKKELLDIDHKIPQCVEAPNEQWNIWPVCLRCHRLKCLKEYTWLNQKNEKKCFSCNKVFSKYFIKEKFWCLECCKFPLHIRVINLECTIKFFTFETLTQAEQTEPCQAYPY